MITLYTILLGGVGAIIRFYISSLFPSYIGITVVNMMCIVLLVYTDEINTKYKSMIQLGLLGGMGSVSTLVLLDKSLLLLIINIIIGTLLYKTLNKLKCKV